MPYYLHSLIGGDSKFYLEAGEINGNFSLIWVPGQGQEPPARGGPALGQGAPPLLSLF